jgi:hypothetical protein
MVAYLNATLLNNLKLKKNIKVKSKDGCRLQCRGGLNEKTGLQEGMLAFYKFRRKVSSYRRQ